MFITPIYLPCTNKQQLRYLCQGKVGRVYVHVVGLTHADALLRGMQEVMRPAGF